MSEIRKDTAFSGAGERSERIQGHPGDTQIQRLQDRLADLLYPSDGGEIDVEALDSLLEQMEAVSPLPASLSTDPEESLKQFRRRYASVIETANAGTAEDISAVPEKRHSNRLFVRALPFAAALMLEKAAMKKNGTKGPIFHTRKIAMIGMFSAIAMILHLFDFPLPFAPDFYKLDFSELPILVGTFAFGPAAGVMMEFVKILLKLMVKGTSTAFVGDLANFVIGCSFILPASVVYAFRKNKKTAVIACITGTLIMTVFGTAFNAIYLLPAFSELYHLPLENILAMGSAVNPLMTEGSIVSFVAACVAPMNLIKGVSVSVVTLLIYKPLSPIIKNGHR